MTREEAIKFLTLMRKAVSNFEEYGHDKASMVIECDKAEALDLAIEALHTEVVLCKDCKWYQGVHGVQGHAPCEWFNKQVLWNDFCSNGEPYKGGDPE